MRRFFLAILVAALLSTAAVAFPFSANSGVTEITPATMQGFMNTHKPVFIVFYAPWCGHCKSIHPEWEKFAKSVKDVVKVGAINADQHKELGQQFGIKGFPTIKYWKMGNKKGMKPNDYNGGRTAGAIQSAALAEIHTKGVTNVVDEAAVAAAVSKVSAKKAILLLTDKKKCPPIFSVLSQSPHFSGKIGFLLATSATSKALISSYEIAKLPSLLLVSQDDSGALVKEPYDGAIDYTSIGKYLQKVLGVSASDNAEGKDDTKQKTSKSSEEADKTKKEEKKSTPKLSLPVRPVPLVPAVFPAYCGHGSLKIKGQQPLCVVSFNKAVDLTALHQQFSNEGVLFFDASSGVAPSIPAQLSSQLGTSVKDGDVLIIRAFKTDAAKFHVVQEATSAAVDTALQKIAGGELAMQKANSFVTLKDDE